MPPKSKNKPAERMLEIEFDGKTYKLRLSDFTGADDLDIYHATGFSLSEIFGGRITLFTVAALVWVTRRRREPSLSFNDVNSKITFSTLETIRNTEAEDNDPGGD